MRSSSFWKCRGPERGQRRAEAVAEPGDELLELGDLEDVRLFVNAVERRRLLRLEIRGHRLVGEEHELLDQPVRDVALERDDRLDHAAWSSMTTSASFRSKSIEPRRRRASFRIWNSSRISSKVGTSGA